MNKKPTIFKQLTVIYRRNPWVLLAFLWTATVPSLGSMLIVHWLYENWGEFVIPSLWAADTAFLYGIAGALLMGLALIPTTLFAILSGFLFGWQAFLLLVLAYSLASVLGYLGGRALDKDSLQHLLKPYPKAKDIIERKKDQMGKLVFFVRISPVVPFAISNLIFALLGSGLLRVVWFGLLGMLPRTFLAFFTGTLASSIQQALASGTYSWHYPAIGLLLVISLWGIYSFFKR
ncbi:TVP38/TMEM64 family protein [Cyclobacterium salsum]|uniref:TVP38/TMEM64 family protein n=1 Tax=Cyclobacterium salsum TaxID=2666329 RepID=UPI0013917105|nr:VTT domain-containing protein [Cyclobacterium salsum]